MQLLRTSTTEAVIGLTTRYDSGRKQLIVPTVVGGRSTPFLLDTGASGTCVAQWLAEELRLTAVAQASVATAVGRDKSIPLVRLDGLRLGTLPPLSQTAAVLDLAWLDAGADRSAGDRLAGILGADFLFRTGGVIDFDRLTLRLTDPLVRDWRRLQGRWRSSSVVRNGHTAFPTATLSVTGDRATIRYDQPDGVRAYRGLLRLSRSPDPCRFGFDAIELLDPPMRARAVRVFGFRMHAPDDPLVPFYGRYDLGPERLVMVLPADLRQPRRTPPDRLQSPVNGGFDLITFERVRHGAVADRWPLPVRLAAWAAGRVRLGGWRLADPAGGDVALAHDGRRLRLELGVGGPAGLTTRPR
jgi:hypothetical protein